MLKKYIPTFINILSSISPNIGANLAINLFSRPRRFERNELELALFHEGTQITFASGRRATIWGDKDAPLIFLCHGWESRGTQFHVIIRALLKQNYQVIGWNAPAHGASPGRKTQVLSMTLALIEDLASAKLVPIAFIGHSMGGAIIGLLHRYIKLPKILVFISAPTNIRTIFNKYFATIRLSPKAQKLMIDKINSLSQHSIDSISLINSDIYKDRAPLIVHDENDKEVPFSEFTNLQNIWPNGEFHATQGLGHKRILRDEALAETIAAFVKENL
uniref:Serine aminopeptidase S33 domain-containing protein n=1 Tax=OCS116 cluster bacterium TaxID=2030921 RepID=A0A2A4YQY4_9PROT